MKPYSSPITGRYNHNPNETISLKTGEFTLHLKEPLNASGELNCRFLPRPRVILTLAINPLLVPDYVDASIFGVNERASFVKIGGTFKVSVDNGETCRTDLSLQGTWAAQRNAAKEVKVHVANFHDYVGMRLTDDGGFYRGRLEFSIKEWVVLMDALPDIGKRVEYLNNNGGFAITHICRITRADGLAMSAQEIDDLLDCLTWFLYFVRGSRIALLFPFASDGMGGEAYSEFASNKLDEWSRASSWLPLHQPDALGAIANNFYDLWADPEWVEPLYTAIAWYTEINHQAGGVEGSLIISQAALEMLFYVVMVENTATPAVPGQASDNIEVLLDRFQIPTSIPDEFAELTSQAATNGWTSGPVATVSLRNAFVHPRKVKRKLTANASMIAKWEALRLNQWYLEMVLLKMFGYLGNYINRITHKLERMP